MTGAFHSDHAIASVVVAMAATKRTPVLQCALAMFSRLPVRSGSVGRDVAYQNASGIGVLAVELLDVEVGQIDAVNASGIHRHRRRIIRRRADQGRSAV